MAKEATRGDSIKIGCENQLGGKPSIAVGLTAFAMANCLRAAAKC